MATTTIFTGAFLVGLVILIIKRDFHIKKKDWIAGFLLGVPNYFSIYFLILALQQLTGQSTGAIFAVNNVGVILVSTLGSILFFKDKLNKMQTIGLTLSIVSILIITLAI
jgi:drug/metabolite transporter (DMT)-like permease